MTRVHRAAAVLAVLVLGACHFAPTKKGLCYTAAGRTADFVLAEGVYRAKATGAEVTVDLSPPHARLAVTVRNVGDTPIDVRLGGDGAVPETVAGEVLQRPMDTAAVEERPDVAPLGLWQTVRVRPGWWASFFLDSVLGRAPGYGQSCTLVVELRAPDGAVQRRCLPLIVRYVASTPQSPAR